MPKWIKILGKTIIGIVLIPIIYFLFSLALSYITVNQKQVSENLPNPIYLRTNGVHLDVILPISHIDSSVLKGLKFNTSDKYLAFGWGDKDFYLNTPTWDDLTLKTAVGAMLLESSTLMHVTRFKGTIHSWTPIYISDVQLQDLNYYLLQSFALKNNLNKSLLIGKGYYNNDDFYEAKGSYSAFYTCNSWVNDALKSSGIKACYWTPFDFRLLDIHEN